MKKLTSFPTSEKGILLRNLENRDDLSFVLKSWIRDYTHPKNPWAGSIGKKHLTRAVKATILDLIADPNVAVIIACSDKRRDQFFGFLCYEDTEQGPILHYIYVKAAFRGNGIGSRLIATMRGSYEGPLRYAFKNGSKFLKDGKFYWNAARRNR